MPSPVLVPPSRPPPAMITGVANGKELAGSRS